MNDEKLNEETSEEKPAEKKEKPLVGNIQLKEGKATIFTEEGSVAFDLDFVLLQIKKATRNSRQGYYTTKIREYAKILKVDGLDGIDIVTPRLKALSAGSDVNRDFLKQIQTWLGQLKMFRNIKTAPPKEEIKEEEVKK